MQRGKAVPPVGPLHDDRSWPGILVRWVPVPHEGSCAGDGGPFRAPHGLEECHQQRQLELGQTNCLRCGARGALEALRATIGSTIGVKRRIIDADALIGLCANHPSIMDAFDAIVECGLRLVQQRERERLEAVYRHPVSPAKSGQRGGCIVKSPGSGMRFRPTLYDLRPMNEVHELMPKHATSSSW